MRTYEELVKILIERDLTIATAESCTGGGIAAAITEIPGSSACFGYGIVSYANEAKQRLLGVSAAVLDTVGAVSPETAKAMAMGARRVARSDLALAVTGIAGPDGGSADKPVGLVYIGLATPQGVQVRKNLFKGARSQVRYQTRQTALEMALAYLEGDSDGKL